MLEPINLPSITCEEENKNHAVFTVRPLYPGYGMTVGNALRRVMLSSLSGAAVISVKVEGVDHEFSTIPHVKEDMIEIILNLKQLRFKIKQSGDEVIKLELKGRGEKILKGKDIKLPAQVELLNPDIVIATLGKQAKFNAEIEVAKGRGYVPVEDRENEPKEVGKILVDASFTPVKKVRYSVDNVRVGKRTDFDQVVFEIETDGSITPREALAQSAQFLEDHFRLFLSLSKSKEKEIELKAKTVSKVKAGAEEKGRNAKSLRVEEIGLSGRTIKVLVDNRITTVKRLLSLTEKTLGEKKGVGEKAVREIKSKLKKLGLSLKG